MSDILKYFPDLKIEQQEQFDKLQALYEEWNEKINLISRKDIESFYLHHVLHSLSIALLMPFEDGLKILDLGAGGGFPGIPLAILYPECHFTLVDSRKKKMTAVDSIANELGLTNVTTVWSRAEDLDLSFDLIVCRAVAPIDKLLMWIKGKVIKSYKRPTPGGLIALKGGNLHAEIGKLSSHCTLFSISDIIDNAYFNEKKLVYFPRDCVYL